LKRLLVLASLLLFLGCSVTPPEKRVLIYTRNGQGYVHDNVAASVAALENILTRRGISADVSDDPALFTTENLQRYSALVFSNTNNEAFDTDEQRLALVHYIQAGGGFMAIHSGCASERQWPWYWSMVGGTFVRHPKLQTFDIKVVDRTHPSTDFLEDVWTWEDECYFLNHLNPGIRVLLAVDLRTLVDPEAAAYPGEVFGHYFPLAWYQEFEGGRQFYTSLGHKIEYYSDPAFLRHLEGGLVWTIGEGSALDYSKATTNSIELIEKAPVRD
jgi:uncharacterized protein